MIPAVAHIGDRPSPRRRRRSLAARTAGTIGRAVAEVLENDTLASGSGLLQGLDPRVRLGGVVLFAVTASLVHSLPVLLALIALTVGVAAASGIAAGSFATRLASSAGVFAFLLAAPAATGWITPGDALVGHGAWSVTWPGLVVAARLFSRVLAGAGIGLLVVWTTRWPDLLAALSAMRVPDMVVSVLAMAQKQAVSLMRTVQNLHLARESRMLAPASAAADRAWVVDRMAFVAQRSVRTADEVYDAMLARGFDGHARSLVRLRANARDAALALAGVAVCAAAVVADRVVFPL